jgi:hypothetical protein
MTIGEAGPRNHYQVYDTRRETTTYTPQGPHAFLRMDDHDKGADWTGDSLVR